MCIGLRISGEECRTQKDDLSGEWKAELDRREEALDKGNSIELSCEKCILETGKRQPEAIELYKKNGYRIIPNYGQYAGIENSVCFEKEVK